MKQGRAKMWNREEMLSDELMAATIGDVEWLRLSLNKAKGKVAVDRNGYNAMHYAAQNGRLECLRVLVEEYQMDVNLPDPRGWRPIHMILNKECQFRAHKCLKYLLQIGADPSVQTVDGQSPLHQAAEVGLLDCITTLVEAGANVKAKDKKGQTALDLAKIWGHRACVRYLSDLVWKANSQDLLREMQKLQKLKLVLLSDEHWLCNIQQEEQDRLTKEQYALWLERKQLPDTVRVLPSFYRPRATFTEEMLRQLREAVNTNGAAGTGKVVRSTKPKAPCRRSGSGRREGRVATKPVSETLACASPAKGKAAVCRRRSAWNASTKPASLPVPGPPEAKEDVFDLDAVIQQHDFGPFYQLEMNRARQPELRAKADPRVTRALPSLPLHVLRQELFPGSIAHRIKIPEEFKAVHVFNIPRKRASGGSKSEWLELGVSFPTTASSSTTTERSQRTPQSLGKPCSLQGAATNHSPTEDSAPVSREPSPIAWADSPREDCKP